MAATAAGRTRECRLRRIMTQSHGLSIFCDDIRDEVRGQKTLVGVHSGDLVVERGLPVILPALAIYVTVVEPWEEATGPLTVKIYVPGESGDRVVVDTDLPVDRRDGAGGVSGPSECLFNMLSFRLSPLLIEKEGRIRVRAYKGDEEIRLGTLLVTNKRETSSKAVNEE